MKYPTEADLTRISPKPRVTEAAVEGMIIAEHYFTAHEARLGSVIEGTYETRGRDAGSDTDLNALKLLTFCVLVLENGFMVTGESACASPDNYDREIGEAIARRNAVSKIWGHMGYELKTRLHHQEQMALRDPLGEALTMLVAHSMGNNQVLAPDHARIILSELIPNNIETNEEIAKICHEANRAWCELNGDTSQPSWEETPAWQRESAIAGVAFVRANPNAGDSAQHESWMAMKLADGWRYGPDKDTTLKTHPCLVPFEELPHEQQFKDKLFRSIVLASLRPPLAPTPNHLRVVAGTDVAKA